MGLDQAMTGPLVAGVGFRRGTSADEIVALIASALAQVGAGPTDLAEGPVMVRVAAHERRHVARRGKARAASGQ